MRIMFAMVMLLAATRRADAQVPGNPLALGGAHPALDAYVVSTLERQPQRPCALEEQPTPGSSTPLKFDQRGRLVAVGSGRDIWTLAPTYDTGGRVTTEKLSHGTSVTTYLYQYDKSGRAIAQTSKEGAKLVLESRFTYQGGRMTSMTEHLACCGDYKATMTYDDKGRLESMTTDGHPPMVLRLSYDDKGRLESLTRGQSEAFVFASFGLQYSDNNLVSEISAGSKVYTARYTCTSGKK